MGDLTGQYFARMSFINAVDWLIKYESIPGDVYSYYVEKKAEAKELKKKFEEMKIKTNNL